MKSFANKEDLFNHLRQNKELLLMEKQAQIKHADACSFVVEEDICGHPVVKSDDNDDDEKPKGLKIKVVINTTNLMDSHDDVHMVGLWNKTLKEQKLLYLLKEHKMAFDSIITDKVKASAEMLPWKSVGEKYQGETQALIFDAELDEERNPYMVEQYRKGYVKNHSVGMRYVKLLLAMDSTNPADKEEKKNWDKYIDQVANKDRAQQKGYFFPVLEAKLIEGSAVPLGSNSATPTLTVEEMEPGKSTPTIEPVEPTQKSKVDWNVIANHFKNKKF